MDSAAWARPEVAVIVLAAGHGRRLGEAGGAGPKWLIEVAGEPIAERHLTAVELALGPDADVRVVVGHAAERVERYCAARAAGTRLRPRLVMNDLYAQRNNWYSLLVGLDALEAEVTGDTGVVVVNSDLYASPQWLASMLTAIADVDVPGALAVDVARPLTEEAMKVAAGPPDAAGRRWCTAIGKVGVADPVGEYIGITALAPAGRALVHDALRSFAGDEGKADAWYEEAFQTINRTAPFLALCPTPSSSWVEIDDAHDLLTAEQLPGR